MNKIARIFFTDNTQTDIEADELSSFQQYTFSKEGSVVEIIPHNVVKRISWTCSESTPQIKKRKAQVWSVDGKQRIIDAQKRRWSAYKSNKTVVCSDSPLSI
jgi:hypothetical protein